MTNIINHPEAIHLKMATEFLNFQQFVLSFACPIIAHIRYPPNQPSHNKSYQGIQLDGLVGCSAILILAWLSTNPEVYIIEQFLTKKKIEQKKFGTIITKWMRP